MKSNINYNMFGNITLMCDNSPYYIHVLYLIQLERERLLIIIIQTGRDTDW